MEKHISRNYPNPILWKAGVKSYKVPNTGKMLLPNNKIIHAGTIFDLTNERYYKSCKVYEDCSSNHLKVFKEHNFSINDLLISEQPDIYITNIDTSNEKYDLLILDNAYTVSENEIINTNAPSQGSESQLIVVTETITFEEDDIPNGIIVPVAFGCIFDNNLLANYASAKINNGMIRGTYF